MITKHIGIVCLTVTLALLVAVNGWLPLNDKLIQAAPGVLYVAPGGNCGTGAPCYDTVQAAIDASASGDEIRIAAGVYSGVNNQGGKSQVVYIAKSLTLRGGYTTANWNTPDPEANVTEINAQTLGRVVYISGTETIVTLEGLHFTYGDSSGLGGHSPTPFENYDAGGGVYVDGASVICDQCAIGHSFSPSNGFGGGLYLTYGGLTMTGTLVEENEAGSGGGVYLYKTQSQIGSSSIFYLNDGSAIRVVEGIFTLQDSQLLDNEGGGVSIHKAPVVITGNVISGSNGSGISIGGGGSGGSISYNTIRANVNAGLSIGDGNFEVAGNEIAYNRGSGYDDDPGVIIKPVWGGDVTLRNNHIHHNGNTYSSCRGAGVHIDTGPNGLVTLAGNLIEDNFAGEDAVISSHGYGGGVYLTGDNILLDGNIIRNNTAFGFIHAGNQYWGGHGGGVYINDSPTLQNNIIAGNIVLAPEGTHFHGPGIYVNGGSPELIHNTLAQNHGGDGVGLYVIQDSSTGERSQVQMFNTIVASHTVGIYAPGQDAENIVVAGGILWSGNTSNTWGSGTFFLSNERTGDPRFVNPAGGDYHIGSGSAALDNGIVTDVTDDVDGQARPHYGGYDLGADEAWAVVAAKCVAPTQALPGETVTFTIVLTNTTAASMSVRVADALPAQINYIGPISHTGGTLIYTPQVITWTGFVAPITPTRIIWAGQVVSDVQPGDIISNVAAIRDAYGVFQTDPALILVPQSSYRYVYLPLVLRND